MSNAMARMREGIGESVAGWLARVGVCCAAMRAIGVMSGTSCDGADAVMIELEDPRARAEATLVSHAFAPYPDALRRELCEPATLTTSRIAALGYELPRVYAQAVRSLPALETAEVCGCHGQTVWHAPPSSGAEVPCTLQLGSPSALAELVGLPVVGDFRAADIALGGEGAPIAPVAHWAFTPPEHDGRMVVNVGGIANVTHVTERLEDVWASDVGPGMMIVDALAHDLTGGRLKCDEDAALSRGGVVDSSLVAHVLAHPFFSRREPRSTGREDFGVAYARALRARFSALATADLVLSALVATAECIARVARARRATELLLTGGGAKHPLLRDHVARRAGGLAIAVADSGVFAPSHHEPAAMALIAARTLVGLPSSIPNVTGASRPALLGVVARPSP